ncbi:hypothetical protein ACQKMY_25870 [Peribacillus frigoritolerans]|uniref:hypothetical protein n=1 Tax=Peribacillus frigoritolerans TaxID=450367 RepID=UPI003D058837
MKIKELLDELSITGNTIAKIAKEKVGVGEKKLKAVLHNAGYEYRNSGQKGWYYVGDGEEPLYASVFEFVESKRSSPKVKRTSPVSSPNVKETSPASSQPVVLDVNKGRNEGEPDFTPEEKAILKELIRAYVLDEKQDNQSSRDDDLYQRVFALEKGKKVRKTIVINEEVGALLDKFADQQKFNKSDLIEIAILDLVDKYK